MTERPEDVTGPASADSEDQPTGAPAADAEATETEVIAEPTAEEQLAERTLDLQRLQAEYVNYKKRVDRDRALARADGAVNVLRSLLTVLDDIGRADEHGELVGGFKAVSDSLMQVLAGHKLESFGAKGDPFDPHLHEALFHAGESPDVDTITVETVVRIGYKVGDEVIRHAQVGVVDPASETASESGSAADSADENAAEEN